MNVCVVYEREKCDFWKSKKKNKTLSYFEYDTVIKNGLAHQGSSKIKICMFYL